jgi:preprotein translocase subunit SecG
MQSILLMLHVLVAIALVALVLVQHGRGADAGAAFGSGASGSVFGSRGPTSFLTRVTTILATVFFLTSLTLAWLASQSVDRGSVVDRVRPAITETATDEVAPGAAEGEVPSAPEGVPALPDAPPAPEVPPSE